MIRQEDVADLQPGDVVEYRRDEWPEGAFVRSPLNASDYDEGLYVLDGQFGVRTPDGRPYEHMATLTVVSRAPRPLYVNHPTRTEPVPGDVVREEGPEGGTLWLFDSFRTWHSKDSTCRPEHMQGPLRLLVDGELGQVVQ